jgi:hypothetical protein
MRDDETGKRSLFGTSSRRRGPTSGDNRRSSGSSAFGITVDCSRCGAATRIGPFDLLGRLVRLSLWIPGRTYSRRLVCPACDRRSWVRLRIL